MSHSKARSKATCRDFCDRTRDYWLEWVRRLAFSIDWQDEIIRAAITLKLCNYEETGAIVAALTTSIPEVPRIGPQLGLSILLDARRLLRRAGAQSHRRDTHDGGFHLLHPERCRRPRRIRCGRSMASCTRISLEERTAPALAGYGGDGPVRIGNAAVNQNQHDAYGSIIMAATPMFFDRRLPRPGDAALFHTIEPFGDQAAKLALEPDAGIWEYRGTHSASTRIRPRCAGQAASGSRPSPTISICRNAQPIGAELRTVSESRCSNAPGIRSGRHFRRHFDSEDLDASALLLAELGLVAPDDPRFVATVEAIGHELRRGFHVMRYVAADDFGLPESAFLICRFWLVDALWEIGRQDEARDMFVDALRMRNRYGLLSEDVHPVTGKLWGNFPQTYSMSGLILTAIKLSRSWGDRYWRGSS